MGDKESKESRESRRAAARTRCFDKHALGLSDPGTFSSCVGSMSILIQTDLSRLEACAFCKLAGSEDLRYHPPVYFL